MQRRMLGWLLMEIRQAQDLELYTVSIPASAKSKAGCLARHLALARNLVEGRCPICRATGCPHVQINAAPGWHAARRAEEQRVAQDWQASGEWDELPPCQAPQMPAPQPMPAPPAQQPGVR